MSEEVHKEINDPWRLLSLMLNNMCWCTYKLTDFY